MGLDLSRVKERENLAPRREPHWQRIRPGCYLGYRPSRREGLGTWIGRAYDEDKRRYRLRALGDFANLASRDRFASAKQEAEDFAELVETGGFVEGRPTTIAEACKQYALVVTDAAGRFRRYVYDDPIAGIKLHRLRRHHLLEWRKRLADVPALVSRRKKGPQKTRPRAPASINRDIAMLRAALNRVKAPGAPNTEAAWQEALKAIRNADRQRTLYLDRAERTALLENLDAEALPFVKTLCLLPLRPGAAAQLLVADFDHRTSELTIGKDKTGRPRRILLPSAVAQLFSSQIDGRRSDAPLLPRANGIPWDRFTWNIPIKSSAKLAKLPPETTTYTLRHSTITDLANGGLPLLTIAQISDTSVEMIERHYGHLNRKMAADALATLELI